MAVEFCETFLLQSSVGEGCLNLTNIELDSYTDACVLDIQATDDKELVMSSLATMELECIDIVQRNITYYEEDENGDMVPPPDVVSVVCPNECSFRGQCVDNECSCNEGYTGDDCSLEEGAPPIVHNLRHELCDVRDRPCETAFVIGEKFTSSNNLTCRVQYNKANYNIVYDATALLLSFAEVSCLLLQPNIVISGSGKGSEANSLPVEYSTLSVSNDGEVYSEELLFTVYDSVCIECEDGGNCVKKVKSCLINGVCYGDGFQNQAYPYYICDADNDEYDWTFIGPDPTSGDRTTQDVVTNTTHRMSTPDLIAEVESPKTVLIGVLVGLVVGIAIASKLSVRFADVHI
ncbi:von Willebrand factor D and EGF domain-containing protein-like [Ptychodera flava]|uniref:von Willebrand factor D and EGF domain-containing protein-like n=1 Tax=Ptychodera flava TaxID=63121 RepID=UPI00396A395B